MRVSLSELNNLTVSDLDKRKLGTGVIRVRSGQYTTMISMDQLLGEFERKISKFFSILTDEKCKLVLKYLTWPKESKKAIKKFHNLVSHL